MSDPFEWPHELRLGDILVLDPFMSLNIGAHECNCSNHHFICDPSALWVNLKHATRINLECLWIYYMLVSELNYADWLKRWRYTTASRDTRREAFTIEQWRAYNFAHTLFDTCLLEKKERETTTLYLYMPLIILK